MKNKTPYIVTAIAFVLFNIIAFVIPTEKTATFWTAYVFSMIAFAVRIFVWWRSFDKADSLKSKLLGFPVIYIAFTYLIFQLIIFLIFKFIPSAPVWCAVLVCSLVLGMFAICMISGNVGANYIAAIDQKIAGKRQFIKELQIDAEMLAETETDENVKQRLTIFAKKVKLSDPMSDDSLSELEDEISVKLNAVNSAMDKISAINEVEMLLLKRNKKVKSLKG